MDKVDEMIREALEGEDAEILAQTQELGFMRQTLGILSGRNAWVGWVTVASQVLMFLVGVWCAARFFQADQVLDALKWGLSSAVLLIGATVVKMGLMPMVQANRVIRELRRIELLLAARK